MGLVHKTRVKPPTNLIATPSSSSQIDLSWTASPAPFRVAAYRVEWSADGLTGWTLLYSGTATSTSHTGLTASTTYNYRVSARDQQGNDSTYATGLATTSAAVVASNAHPIIGMVASGGSQTTVYTQAAGDRMARVMHATHGSSFEGAGQYCYLGSVDAFFRYIQARSLTFGPRVKLWRYYLPDTIAAQGGSLGVNPKIESILAAANMWLYKAGTSGALTANYFRTTYTMWNLSTYAPTGPGGLYAAELYAKHIIEYFLLGTEGGANQSVDKAPTAAGAFHDGCAIRSTAGGYLDPGVAGTYAADWDRDGARDYQSKANGAAVDQAFRDGEAKGPDYFHNNSSYEIIGNISVWGENTGGTSGNNAAGNKIGGTTITGMSGKLDGGLMEGEMGASNSPEGRTGGGFALMKSMIEFCKTNLRGGKYVLLHHSIDTQGRDFVNQTQPWVAARYGAGVAVVADVIYTPSGISAPYTGGTQDYSPQGFVWVDEMTCDPVTRTFTGEANSQNGYRWFGSLTDPAWTQLSNGVYRVRGSNIVNGRIPVVYVNPNENPQQTFNIATFDPGKSLVLPIGTQDSAINSGATVTSLVMPMRTARFGWLA